MEFFDSCHPLSDFTVLFYHLNIMIIIIVVIIRLGFGEHQLHLLSESINFTSKTQELAKT